MTDDLADPMLLPNSTKPKGKRSEDAYLRRLERHGITPDGLAVAAARSHVKSLQIMARIPRPDRPPVDLTDAEAAEMLLLADRPEDAGLGAQLLEIIQADPEHRPFSGNDKFDAAGWPDDDVAEAEAEAEIINEPEAEPEPEIIDEPEPGPAGSDPQQMPYGRTLPVNLHESYREDATALAVAIRTLADMGDDKDALDTTDWVVAMATDGLAVPFTKDDLTAAARVLRVARKYVT